MAARQIICTNDTHYTILIYKGVTYSRTFEYTNSDGTPINLTGKSLSIKFKDTFPAQLELFTNGSPSTLGSTFLVTDAVNGKFRLQLTDDETAVAKVGQGKWWIELYSGSDVDLLWLDNTSVVAI